MEHEGEHTKEEVVVEYTQPKKEGSLQKFKSFVTQCRRVLRATKKPDKQEFLTIVKISGLGIIILGAIGFVISFGAQFLIK